MSPGLIKQSSEKEGHCTDKSVCKEQTISLIHVPLIVLSFEKKLNLLTSFKRFQDRLPYIFNW